MFKYELHHSPAAVRSLCCAVEPHLMSYSGFLLWCCCINMFPCLSDESRDCSGRRGGVFYTSAGRKKQIAAVRLPLNTASDRSTAPRTLPHLMETYYSSPRYSPQLGGQFQREMGVSLVLSTGSASLIQGPSVLTTC